MKHGTLESVSRWRTWCAYCGWRSSLHELEGVARIGLSEHLHEKHREILNEAAA